MNKKIVPIRYTSRDFDSIKKDILDHAKRYYPDTYKDFSENSFGSFMVDSVAYIGDILSYYLDYQINESFLDTAIEYDNILKLSRQSGYKEKGPQTTIGNIAIYYEIPAAANGFPDYRYAPRILRGSVFSSDGGSRFTLMDDIEFQSDNVKIVVGDENENGAATYVVKTYGRVISGVNNVENITIGDFEKFKKIEMNSNKVAEILSVTDTEGNEYYEVDYLSQNIIYRAIPNRNEADKSQAPSILKPFQVFRRFTIEKEGSRTFLQFGASSDVNLSSTNSALIEPSTTVLQKYGKEYITDENFDPNILLDTDKFGVAPSNTTLTITFRETSTDNINTAVGSITTVERIFTEFMNEDQLLAGSTAQVRDSFEVENEEPIIGSNLPVNSEELKILTKDFFASQNRAVTQSDYKAMCMLMPSKYGSIKRAKIVKDTNELKRNLNIYVISEDSSGLLVTANNSIKNNLKTWLNKNRMLNDTVDILDAKIVNFGIDFVIQVDNTFEKFTVLNNCINLLKNIYFNKLEIGEPLFINNIYSSLNRVEGVIDVKNVVIQQKNSSNYSSFTFNFKKNMSDDESIIYVPDNVIMEIKYLDKDIKGSTV